VRPPAPHLASSIFLGGYLTSEGRPGADGRRMIADAGFTIEGVEEQRLPDARDDLVVLRHRGAGTDLPANA
jgi:biotin synthase